MSISKFLWSVMVAMVASLPGFLYAVEPVVGQVAQDQPVKSQSHIVTSANQPKSEVVSGANTSLNSSAQVPANTSKEKAKTPSVKSTKQSVKQITKPTSSHKPKVAPAVMSPGTYHWVQFARENYLVARIIMGEKDKCPIFHIDGKAVQTTERENRKYKKEFPIKICQAYFRNTATAQKVSFPDGTSVNIPKKADSIGVIGDTGCRNLSQNCESTESWPAETVAETLTKAKNIDLVIHSGDFMYRRKANSTSVGNDFMAAELDLLLPLRSVFLTYPMLFTRGNHENCDYGGKVWFTLFDVAEHVTDCHSMIPSTYVDVAGTRFLVYDSGYASDNSWRNAGELYKTHVAEMRKLRSHVDRNHENILVTHRPLAHVGSTGYVVNPKDGAIKGCGFTTEGSFIRSAMNESGLMAEPILMTVSGHFHNGELISFDKGLPVQLVMGSSGAELRKLIYKNPRSDVVGCYVYDKPTRYHITNFYVSNVHGYSIMHKTPQGRNVVFYDVFGKELSACDVKNGGFSCK